MRRVACFLVIATGLALTPGCLRPAAQPPQAAAASAEATPVETVTPPGAVPLAELPSTNEGWREKLSPEQFRVARQKGTERPFTNEYCDTKEPGKFRCVGCGVELFSSEHKYDSGTGWPSFWQPSQKEFVGEDEDYSLATKRTEVHCRRCGAHLGHIFDDGPEPTGLRYCLNSAALRFEPEPAVTNPATSQPPVEENPAAGESLFDSENGAR